MPPFQCRLNPSLLGEETTGKDRGTSDGFFHPQFDHSAHRHANGTGMTFADGRSKVLKGGFQKAVGGGDKPCWTP